MTPIDGAFQILVPKAFGNTSSITHSTSSRHHPSQNQMYYSIQKTFIWLQMENDFYKTAGSCSTCSRNGTSSKLKRQIRFFPTSSSLEFVASKVLGPLHCTLNVIQYVIVTLDRYLSLTRAMPAGTTSSAHVANVLFNSLVVSYRIPACKLADNRPHVTSNCFTT